MTSEWCVFSSHLRQCWGEVVAVFVHEVVGVAFVLLSHLFHDPLHILFCEVGTSQDNGFSAEASSERHWCYEVTSGCSFVSFHSLLKHQLHNMKRFWTLVRVLYKESTFLKCSKFKFLMVNLFTIIMMMICHFISISGIIFYLPKLKLWYSVCDDFAKCFLHFGPKRKLMNFKFFKNIWNMVRVWFGPALLKVLRHVMKIKLKLWWLESECFIHLAGTQLCG